MPGGIQVYTIVYAAVYTCELHMHYACTIHTIFNSIKLVFYCIFKWNAVGREISSMGKESTEMVHISGHRTVLCLCK